MKDVDLDMGSAQVTVKLEHEKGIRFPCPECQNLTYSIAAGCRSTPQESGDPHKSL